MRYALAPRSRPMPPGQHASSRRHQQSPGPKRGSSVPGALPVAARSRPEVIALERGRGLPQAALDPPQAVGQTRAGRGAALSAAPPPKGENRSPSRPIAAVPPGMAIPMTRSSLMPLSCAPDGVRVLDECDDGWGDRFLRHCSSRKISTPNWRDRSCTARHVCKSRGTTACAPPSIAGQVPAGLPGLWGKRGRAQARPHGLADGSRLPVSVGQQLSSQPLSVMGHPVRPTDTSIAEANGCAKRFKSGPNE